MRQEQRLASLLSEFARTMLTDFPIQAILDRLVERIVDVLPVSAVGVTLISPGTEPRYLAATAHDALGFENVQAELKEGPGLLAYHSGEAVEVPDLREETRFPRFAPRALAAGLSAVFTFPLCDGERRLGTLDLYRDSPGTLSVQSMKTARTLADVASAYILNATARDDLQHVFDQSRHASLHDALTGLPNRILLLDRLQHAFLRSRRSGQASALIHVELDRLEAVDDNFRHGVGDNLLVAVAGRLEDLLRPCDTLARLSGDQFVMLCEDLDFPEQATAIGARITAALARPFELSGVQLTVSGSIGIAYAGMTDHSPEQLLHEAGMAMSATKRTAGGHREMVGFHHPERHLDDLERDLRGGSRAPGLQRPQRPRRQDCPR